MGHTGVDLVGAVDEPAAPRSTRLELFAGNSHLDPKATVDCAAIARTAPGSSLASSLDVRR